VTALVYALTLLSLVGVIGTRLRLAGSTYGWLKVHTVAGVAGFVVWMVFLIASPSSFLGGAEVGIVGLGLWWLVCVAGFFLLASARPGGGRRVARSRRTTVPWLSILVHVGMLAAWVVNTWAYAMGKV
jgi:hypothetical protein